MHIAETSLFAYVKTPLRNVSAADFLRTPYQSSAIFANHGRKKDKVEVAEGWEYPEET